ncbi:restriction endonuclease subunit S [Marinobacter alkaliphilus]|uniref:restriction endonuclease subunit S n=1 Tax=Marinobacter alkaliphilus TaxID=254719 RepID=UPI003D76897C
MRQVRYPSYKTTKSTWLASIPEHWEEKRLKDVATYNDESLDEKTDPDFEIEYVDISSVSLTHGIEKTELLAFEKAPSRARRKVRHGDVIVSTVRTYLKAIAPIKNPPLNMVVSTGFAVIRPRPSLDARFAGYMLQSNGFVGDVVANSVGVSYPAINASDLARLPFAEPPLAEQRRISDFLDHKTAQIDALIAKKQLLLDKLAEQRTALISQAVTKGLDPSVPMKDSGVEWLGEIPAHWQCLPLRRLSHYVKTGTTPTGINELHFDDEGLPWYKPGDFTDGVFLESAGNKLSQEGVEAVRTFPSDTVMQVGIGATIGKVAIATSPASCNQQINCIHCNEKLHHLFAVYFLRAIRDFIVKCGKYTTLPIINQDETKSLPFTVPSYDEQVTISNYLLEAEKKSSRQSKKVLEIIERLQEYRSALITNAVTGKIDVRDFCIPTTTEQKEVAHG